MWRVILIKVRSPAKLVWQAWSLTNIVSFLMNFPKSYDTNGSAVLPLCQDAASCQLSALMDRVNVRLDPSTFIETVAVAFKEGQTQHQNETIAKKKTEEQNTEL